MEGNLASIVSTTMRPCWRTVDQQVEWVVFWRRLNNGNCFIFNFLKHRHYISEVLISEGNQKAVHGRPTAASDHCTASRVHFIFGTAFCLTDCLKTAWNLGRLSKVLCNVFAAVRASNWKMPQLFVLHPSGVQGRSMDVCSYREWLTFQRWKWKNKRHFW